MVSSLLLRVKGLEKRSSQGGIGKSELKSQLLSWVALGKTIHLSIHAFMLPSVIHSFIHSLHAFTGVRASALERDSPSLVPTVLLTS